MDAGGITGVRNYTVQMVLTPYFYLNDVFLGQLLGAGKASGMHIPSTGEGMGCLQLPRFSLWVKLAITSSC